MLPRVPRLRLLRRRRRNDVRFERSSASLDLSRQLAQPFDQFDRLVASDSIRVDLAQLNQERVGERGEQAVV